MTTKNPFPGMNPFFEQQWRDAHARLITYLSDALQPQLPPDLMVRTETEVVAVGAGGAAVVYRPDELARWLEIRDTGGRLVTVLELLSPTNKMEGEERDRYRRKRRAFLGGGANLVEIDLVRAGASLFPEGVRQVLVGAGACYAVGVVRAGRPSEHEVYPVRLRDRLPVIRVPLRPGEPDVVVDLQALIDLSHERGRYHLLDYRRELDPRLSPEDAAWVNQVLREHALR